MEPALDAKSKAPRGGLYIWHSTVIFKTNNILNYYIMSISSDITTSLDNNDLDEFIRLSNHPALLINDIYNNGLLNYMLEKYPNHPISFYKAVIENINIDLNRFNSFGIPPILQSSRSELIDLLLSSPRCDVNIAMKNKRTVIHEVIVSNNVELLVKLLDHEKIDLAQRYRYLNDSVAPLNFAMDNNMPMFKLMLKHPKFGDINKSFGIHNPLEYAAKKVNIEAIRLLIESGIDINDRVFKDLTIDPRLNIEEHQKLQLEPKHKYYTFAEHAILKNNDTVVDIVIENLDKITKKDRLLELAVKVDNKVTINKLLKAGIHINRFSLEHLIDNEEFIIYIISNPQQIDLNNVVAFILEKNNTILINRMIKLLITSSKFDIVKPQIIVYLKNPSDFNIIENTIESGIFDEATLADILFSSRNSVFYRLMNNNNFDTINLILDKHPGIIPKNILDYTYTVKKNSTITPIQLLIKNNKIDIVRKFIEIGCLTNDISDFMKLLDLNEKGIVKILIEKTNILVNILTIDVFVKLLKLYNNDNLVINKVLLELQNFGILPGVIKKLIIEPDILVNIITIVPDILYKNVAPIKRRNRWNDDDDEEEVYYIAIELFISTFVNNDQRAIILELTKSGNNLETLKREKMLSTAIVEKNVDLFLFILDHMEDFVEGRLKLNSLVKSYGDADINYHVFVMDNIDRLLAYPNIDLDIFVSDIFHESIYNADSELNRKFIQTNLYEKIIAHPNFNPNYQVILYVEGEDDKRVNYIYDIVYNLLSETPNIEKDKTILRMFIMLLAHPDIDVNTITEYDDTSAEYILNQITEYDETIDYTTDENFNLLPAMFNILLVHPNFNINFNRHIIKIATDENFIGLLNRLLSIPELDINGSYLLHTACFKKSEPLIKLLLSIESVDINKTDDDGTTPLHACIEANNTEGALILLEDPRIDLSILDSKGRNYTRLANKAGMERLSEVLISKGQIDDKKALIDREVAEYDSRMARLGRRKEGRIRETLNNFDLILKERERPPPELDEYGLGRQETPYSLSLCPFCLTYLEKANPYECVYLSGHKCPVEIQNEALKRQYFGDRWQTAVFEICCTCGRPCSHHGHYKPVALAGETSSLLPNGGLANHWRCDEHNGGGGKLEMVIRLVGMLSELKSRVDRDERLVYGPELIKELAVIANSSLFNEAIKVRAEAIFGRKKWNANSKIPKYAKFNASNVNVDDTPRRREEREPITHISNVGREDKIQCMICLDDEADDVFKPHVDDAGYICGDCLKRQVCGSRYASVTCELGCNPKKQIYKEDVNALMGGNFCEGVEIVEAVEEANGF
jgi:ankyrin repeat protein